MKKFLTALLALILLMAPFCVSSLAEDQVWFSGSANVRSGPGLDYDSIGVATTDDSYVYLKMDWEDDRGVTWYMIEYDNQIAFVSSKYAFVVENYESYYAMIDTDSRTAVYSDHSTSSTVVGHIAANASGLVCDDENGISGYITSNGTLWFFVEFEDADDGEGAGGWVQMTSGKTYRWYYY